jgi:hypothetical protein
MQEGELLLVRLVLHYLFPLRHVHIYREYFEIKLCHQNAQTVTSRVMHSLHFVSLLACSSAEIVLR